MLHFVGRADALTRLNAVYDAVTGAAEARATRQRAGVVLVSGEAGMGKTALLQQFAAEVAARGAQPVWGTCWHADQAPAFWPWTQVLRELLDIMGERAAAPPELAVVVPELADASPAPDTDSDVARMRVFDAASRYISHVATRRPVVILLDDLHWSDLSTLDLVRFLSSVGKTGPLMVVGAYRHDELSPEVSTALAGLATSAETVALQGLTQADVGELVSAIAGTAAAERWTQAVYERSGGHPFFTRELAHVLNSGGAVGGVPAAVREVIARRLSRISTGCARLLAAAAVAGTRLMQDVLADVTGEDPPRVTEYVEEAVAVGLLAPNQPSAEPLGASVDPTGAVRFVHDLYRESIYASLATAQRLDLHHRVGAALLRRHERGIGVFAAELAHHFARTVPIDGAGPALAWARAAADAEQARFAFLEAAGHLARARAAVAESGVPLTDAELVDVLTDEAEARARGGQVTESRALLDAAWIRAAALGDPSHLGAVALGLDRLGARFAMPRTELVDVLDQARAALAGTGTPAEAQVTAALARQLQHSIPKDRSRARPLAEHAVAIARALDDPVTLARCLLAQHDTLWTAGTATERVTIAREIAEHAERAGDAERHSEALLLTASALLESGSPAFRATLAEYRYRAEALRQPRHDYVLRSREAALALLDGDLDMGERLIADAAELGAAAGDSDTGNVRMSQLLEVARARGDAARLRDTAQQAVQWWVGVPAHAHAVAAGFLARAGDLDGARRELDTVLALDDWRSDRSYLWSVFVGELATAAIALGDHPLCTLLLDDLLPVAATCAVNGALVCFMGAHAHRVGLLHAALGRPADARDWLERALATHRQLGARAWEAETCSALAALGGADANRHAARATELGAELGLHALTPSPARTAESGTAATTAGGGDAAELRRVGDLWQASFRGQSAYLRDAKGLHDLAVLLARPGVDVPALELAGTAPARTATTAGAMAEQPVLDGAALRAYRRRLSELDEELSQADDTHDLGRQERAAHEREQLLTELRRATRPGGGVRTLGLTAAERARKAVTGRIRDAIRRIDQAVPALGTHLDRCIRTGTTCRYDPYA